MDRAHKIAQERLPINEADRSLEHQNQIKREIFCNGYYAAEKDLGWHSVDECLPEIGEEVIALTNQMNGKMLDTARRICIILLVLRSVVVTTPGPVSDSKRRGARRRGSESPRRTKDQTIKTWQANL